MTNHCPYCGSFLKKNDVRGQDHYQCVQCERWYTNSRVVGE